jgi:adenine specific DNA methylase Mod
MIIEGDNLIALEALLLQFTGKVTCIHIDPLYNTGKEGLANNDKVNILDAEIMVSGQLPTYNQFVKYVYYLCTGENPETRRYNK